MLVKPKEHSGTTVTTQSKIHLRAPEAERTRVARPQGNSGNSGLRAGSPNQDAETEERSASRDWTDAQGPSSQAPINPSARSTAPPSFNVPAGTSANSLRSRIDRSITQRGVQGCRVGRVGTHHIPRRSYVFRGMGWAAPGGPHQRPVATWKARVRHTQFTECHKGTLSERM